MVEGSPRSTGLRLGAAVAVGVVIWFAPSPEGVTADAWHLFAIFIATIVGIILEPLPMGAVAVCGLAAVTLTGTLGLADALSGFSHSVIWLVVTAFFISRGFIKTGLGARIAYSFVRLLGKRSLGLCHRSDDGINDCSGACGVARDGRSEDVFGGHHAVAEAE